MDIAAELGRFGAAQEDVKLLVQPEWHLIRYLDLLPSGEHPNELLPSGVVEVGDRPVLYVVAADALSRAPEDQTPLLNLLLRRLACRGDGTYLGVLRPGHIDIYPVTLTRGGPPRPQPVVAEDSRAPLLINDLASGEFGTTRRRAVPADGAAAARAEAIHRLLFRLLSEVTTSLKETRAIACTPERDDVLPLVGRALFTRFLLDRRIINSATFPRLYSAGKPEDCFSSPTMAAATCAWLDRNFNGELLPLAGKAYQEFFESVHRRNRSVLQTLSNVLYRSPGGQLSFDLNWDGIDFAHVPVGLLSEVYEDYANKFFGDDARRESIRYTPRAVAEYTVNEAFAGLDEAKRDKARVLDPAAGAGVFLVLAFQRLVAERWRSSRKRPQTADIHEILFSQIRGFDINNSAMTLAALSMYLTALEMDPAPLPPEKLRFAKPLLGNVLFNMRSRGETYPYSGHVLGSLGPMATSEVHVAAYDLVIGNPPWTAWKGKDGKKLNRHATEMIRQVAMRRGADDVASSYEHNDMVPDVPFAFRATQWCRPQGIIALILHARILFKRSERGAGMRDALFRCMRVTGFLNGADLAPLWPHLTQPFCILFARNRTPSAKDVFYFVSPQLDHGAAGRYRMRVDADSSQPIHHEALLRRPFLLKTLYRGSRLDVDLVTRLSAMLNPIEFEAEKEAESAEVINAPIHPALPVARYWNERRLASGQGYFPGTARSTSEILKREPKHLTTHDNAGLRVSAAHLDDFRERRALWPRHPRIYEPPMVLISEGQGESSADIRARMYTGKRALVFNRSFYGFSAAGHPQAETLVAYLFAVVSSDLFIYYTLQTSAKFGVERRTILVEDVEELPLVPLEGLDAEVIAKLHEVVNGLAIDDAASWRRLNAWVNRLYGLTTADEQLVADTLATRMPFARATNRALGRAGTLDKRTYAVALEKGLAPFFDDGESINVSLVPSPVESWVLFDVRAGDQQGESQIAPITRLAIALAHQTGASRIFEEVAQGHLRVAVRNQYRYLTRSQGRLCAIDILREKSQLFPLLRRAA